MACFLGLDFPGKRFLLLAFQNGRVYLQTGRVFDHFRAVDRAAHRLPDECGHHADEQAEKQGNRDDQQAFRLDRLFGHDRLIDQARRADLAGLGQAQLLGGIQQRGIQLGIHLDIPHAGDDVLLDTGQSLDLFLDSGLL